MSDKRTFERRYMPKVKAVFARFGLKLDGAPYENKIHKLVKAWLKTQHFESIPRLCGHGIDIPDFIFWYYGRKIVMEVKGHSKSNHNITKILNQLRRYVKYGDCLVYLTHCPSSKSQVDQIIPYTDKYLRDKLITTTIEQLPNLPLLLDEFFGLG